MTLYMLTYTYANTKLNTHVITALIFLSFVQYYDTWMHIGIVQFYFLSALSLIHPQVGQKKKVHNWSIQPKAETDPTWLFIRLGLL